MASNHCDLLEEFGLLLEARQALVAGDHAHYSKIAEEIAAELGSEYCTQLPKKIHRWVDATVFQFFEDVDPVRFLIQAKMLYRDGYYEATIMLCRSTAERVCYDLLKEASHPFGSEQKIEKVNFRKLLDWLHDNDTRIDSAAFKHLNRVYDIGNKYVHPKSGQNPPEDAIEAIHALGAPLSHIYGLKEGDSMVGRRIKSAYCDFPDINSGLNFMLTAFLSPVAAEAHHNQHHEG